MKTIKLNDISIEVTKEQLEQALAEINRPEFDYPLCFKSRTDNIIVLFNSLSKGIRLNGYSAGTEGEYLTPHTDKDLWEQIPYDTERGFYHKQPVYCWWEKRNTHSAYVRFYDAINKRTFDYTGREGATYGNYSATMPEHMLEFKEK